MATSGYLRSDGPRGKKERREKEEKWTKEEHMEEHKKIPHKDCPFCNKQEKKEEKEGE